jgi:hypothetical protein
MLLPLILTGCEATHLMYVSDAALGVDLSISGEGRSRFVVGYDRFTGAIVPRKPDTASSPGDAMTLTSVSRVEVAGLDDIEFHHVIATGEAAKKAAVDAEVLKSMREAVYGPAQGEDK